MQNQHVDEVSRARLAFVTAGRRPMCAPRRAHGSTEQIETEALPNSRDEAADPKGPFRLSSAHAIALVLLLLLGVAIAVFALLRSATTTVPVKVAQAAVSSSSPVPQPSSAAAQIRVHVTGAVTKPGVVRVASDAIALDAINAAGGLTEQADPAGLNLAAPLSDGAQIVIGTTSEPAGELVGTSTAASSNDGLININQASAAQLEDLPGVGPVMAEAIVAWREEHGEFTKVEDLQEVSGIGPKTFEKLAPLVKV